MRQAAPQVGFIVIDVLQFPREVVQIGLQVEVAMTTEIEEDCFGLAAFGGKATQPLIF